MKKFIFSLILCMLLVASVSAWSNNTFNNSLTIENLTFSGSESFYRYLKIPSTITALTSSYLNLSGLNLSYTFKDFSGSSSIQIGMGTSNTRIAERFSVGGKIIDTMSFYAYCDSSCDENLIFRIRDLSDNILSECNYGSANITVGLGYPKYLSCAMNNSLFLNGEYYFTMERNGTSGTIWTYGDSYFYAPYPSYYGVACFYDGSSWWGDTGITCENVETRADRMFFLFKMNFSDGTDYIYPNNITLTISNPAPCYQESANTSNQKGTDGSCSLSYTGKVIDGTTGTTGGCANGLLNDGLLNTCSRTDADGWEYSYINYTKPSKAIDGTWLVSIDGLTWRNYTLSTYDCFNSNPIQIIFATRGGAGWWGGYADCITSTGSQVHLYNLGFNGHIIYEEAMNWTVLGDTAYNYTGGFNLTNEKTFNLATIINKYLTSTYLVGSYYLIPFIFSSATSGILQYSGLIFSNEEFIINSQTYNPTTNPTKAENISINITYDANAYAGTPIGTLYYNGTSYAGTYTAGIFSTIAIVPSSATSKNYSFYWQIGLVTGAGAITYVNSTTQYQYAIATTSIIINTTCPSGYYPSMNFTFADEANLTTLNANVNYIFRYGYEGNTSAVNVNSSFAGITGFSLCVNSSEPAYTISYGEIQYETTGYTSRRFYVFSGTRATNTTISNTLYLLQNALATSFLLQVQDNQLNNYVGYYVSLLRWYPNLDQYKVVEMAKTDDKGQTVVRVKTEDVDYRFGIYSSSGTLIKLVNPLRMVCLLTPCSYNLFVTPTGTDYNTINKIQVSLTYNYTTNKFILIWNDPSQSTTEFNLKVYKLGALSNTLVCNNSATGFTGLLECDMSAQTGNFRAEAYRSASPPLIIAEALGSIKSTLASLGTNGKAVGIFFVTILIILTALIGIFNPIMSVILGLLTLIPASFIGAISPIIGIGFAILGGIVIHYLKNTNG